MKTVIVDLGTRAYPIHIGGGLIDRPELFAPHIVGNNVAIVSNTTVAPLYAQRLTDTLARLGKHVQTIILPDGEAHKDWSTLNQIFDALLGARADRKTTLLALGGGVIGDCTGFAAAVYMRGIPFIQVPTTLLAQVDSSVGGKTGINHPLGKNMLGAFHQPGAVIADTDTLATLPSREIAAGLAEVIKSAAIADASFFNDIETHIGPLRELVAGNIADAVERTCKIKAAVVAADERDSGVGARAHLNFRHTFGHAIEAGLGYGDWLHGEAVGAGMVMAADLSVRLGLLDQSAADRLTRLIDAAGLPTRGPALGTDRYIELMKSDKKANAGEVYFVLIDRIGHARVTTVPGRALLETLAACSADGTTDAGASRLPPDLADAADRRPERQAQSGNRLA